jgi:hypothetical protein
MHAKFITLGMHSLHVIPEEITKWNIQLMHFLAVIAFLNPTKFNF